VIDALASPPIPDLIKLEPNRDKCNSIPHFPHLWGPAPPPQDTSHHWIHSVIYNWPLCPKCCIGATQSKLTMSKMTFSLDYKPQIVSLHNFDKPSKKPHFRTCYYSSVHSWLWTAGQFLASGQFDWLFVVVTKNTVAVNRGGEITRRTPFPKTVWEKE